MYVYVIVLFGYKQIVPGRDDGNVRTIFRTKLGHRVHYKTSRLSKVQRLSKNNLLLLKYKRNIKDTI